MRTRSIVPAVVFAAFVATAAQAAVCDGRSMTVDEIAAAIKATKSCDAAMTLFRDCALGSSGDIRLGDAATTKCEGAFLSRFNSSQRRGYARALERCARKYRDESGTMYRSAEAFCRAETAQRNAHRRP